MERRDETAVESEFKRLEEEIEEVKRRLPAHSVKPPIMMELLQLEDRRDALLKAMAEMRSDGTKCRGEGDGTD
jgi:hypothetical protein